MRTALPPDRYEDLRRASTANPPAPIALLDWPGRRWLVCSVEWGAEHLNVEVEEFRTAVAAERAR